MRPDLTQSGATDETAWMTRRAARHALYHHPTGRGRPQAAGLGAASVHSGPPQSTLGGGHHPYAHLVWLCPRGLCGRRLRPHHRWLAGAEAYANGFNPGRASAGCCGYATNPKALSTTATEAASISLSAIPNGWRRPASMPRLAAWATLATMPLPRLSTGCTRQR